MSVIGDQTQSRHQGNERSQLQFYPLRFESIANEFDIGKHNKTHDFDNHLKVAVREGVYPSISLAELADKTETDEQFQAMAGSTFSRDTNDRAVVAVGRFLFEVLHTPQLSHQRAVHRNRNRLEWLTRGVGAVDATNLSNSLAHSSSLRSSSETTSNPSEIDTEDEGLSFTVPHAWTVNTSIRLVQLSQKVTLTKVRSVTISEMMSRSANASTQSSGYVTVDTRTTNGSVR